MATAREIITRSLKRIRVVGIMDAVPSEIMTHSLTVLNDLLTAYEADHLTTETVLATGTIANGSATITGLNASTNLYNTSSLVVGMEVVGNGVEGRIHEIKSADEIKLTVPATVSGSVDLTFSALPMDDSLTEALIAVLAVRLAEDFGTPVGPVLNRDARRGQAQIDGEFLKVPTKDGVDSALLNMPSRRTYSGDYNG